MCRLKLKSILSLILLLLVGWQPVFAQQSIASNRPVDMMILIDNSCSMFPVNQILPGCDSYGSDPNFLRIIGADLFIARLGFAESNEAEYQLGVIGFGSESQVISALQPLVGKRDQLAAQIANPKPQSATKIYPALEKAYNELRTSPNRKADNLPAVVLITDGIPWPREGQSNADIEQLIQKNKDIPLFIIILKDPAQTNPDLESYIQFWDGIQIKDPYVSVSLITSADQIQETYNQILGRLQNTIPTRGVAVDASKPFTFTVGAYNQRIIVTIIRKPGMTGGQATIIDPDGKNVASSDPGVVYFRGKQNPIEVYSISAPRLAPELKGKTWTIKTTDAMTILINREGSYRIHFIAPTVKATDITNLYQALERQSLNQGFTLRFSLIDDTGQAVIEDQPIWGDVINPEGKSAPVEALKTLKPKGDGTYEITLDMNQIFPGSVPSSGQYTLDLNAGLVDETSQDVTPISSARLLVDLGSVPSIRSIAPLPVLCYPGQPVNLRITIGDLEAAQEPLTTVRVLQGSQAVILEKKEPGVYTGDISPLCQVALTTTNCGVAGKATFTAQLDVGATGETTALSNSQEIQANITVAACTATPLPTPLPTPTPTPTPIPDSDHDGLNDINDRCPTTPGFPFSQGCIPWDFFAKGAAGLGILAFAGLWVWPWARVRWISPPPQAYIRAYRAGEPASDVVDIRNEGIGHRTNHISIGGRKRTANIYVEGLEPLEFYIEWQGELVTLRDRKEKEPFAFFDEEVQIIRTSDPKVTLRISLDPEKLKQ